MASPEEALGADLFDHLPEGPEGRRWRALLSEAQVALHQHPLNGVRVAAGKPPVNSLWFWGGGVLPDHVTTPHKLVQSNEITLRALAKVAGVEGVDLSDRADGLVDLRAERDLRALAARLESAMTQPIRVDCEDGTCFSIAPSQRWRFWRKPLKAIDA